MRPLEMREEGDMESDVNIKYMYLPITYYVNHISISKETGISINF